MDDLEEFGLAKEREKAPVPVPAYHALVVWPEDPEDNPLTATGAGNVLTAEQIAKIPPAPYLTAEEIEEFARLR